jgi:hypothetical protein
MPVYFIHGFRWPRALIRIHIILHNLEDSAAEWLVAPATTREMLDSLTQLYPDSSTILTIPRPGRAANLMRTSPTW